MYIFATKILLKEKLSIKNNVGKKEINVILMFINEFYKEREKTDRKNKISKDAFFLSSFTSRRTIRGFT